MSSLSTSVGTILPAPSSGETAPKPIARTAPVGKVAAGVPVDVLPPLIEPVGFDEPATPTEGRRAARQSFLAPVAKDAETRSTGITVAAKPAVEAVPVDTRAPETESAEIVVSDPPAPVAAPPRFASLPTSEPSPQIENPPLIEPAGESRIAAIWNLAAARAAQWLGSAGAMLPTGHRQRVAIAVGSAALLLLGLIYVTGIGPFSGVRHYHESPLPEDPAQRLVYYQSGAKAGDAEAALQLAMLYAKGEGVDQDYAAAATWFRAAANQGVPRAQYDLGIMYERGRGVPVDLVEAARWYQKAAEGKHPLAQYNLAVCYTKGQGVRQDLPEAALWYRRAAGQGVVQAMINLGMLYEKGQGVATSPVDAYAWYLTAGRRDSQPAARRAADIYASLPQLDKIRADALASDVAASIHDPGR
jgi:hypothetical protein